MRVPIFFYLSIFYYSVHRFTTCVAPKTGELTAAFMRPSTLDEMMVQVRELRMQRSNVIAGFRFQGPTPACDTTSFCCIYFGGRAVRDAEKTSPSRRRVSEATILRAH